MRVNGSVFKSRFVLYQQSGFFFLASARIESSSTGSTLILPTEIYRLGRKQKGPAWGQKRFAHKKRSTEQPIQSLQRFMYECPVYFGMSGSRCSLKSTGLALFV